MAINSIVIVREVWDTRDLVGSVLDGAGALKQAGLATRFETEDLNARLTSAQVFSRLLPDTPQKFLGLYNDGAPQTSREAALRNHLMVRRNYEALLSGDGACAATHANTAGHARCATMHVPQRRRSTRNASSDSREA